MNYASGCPGIEIERVQLKSSTYYAINHSNSNLRISETRLLRDAREIVRRIADLAEWDGPQEKLLGNVGLGRLVREVRRQVEDGTASV